MKKHILMIIVLVFAFQTGAMGSPAYNPATNTIRVYLYDVKPYGFMKNGKPEGLSVRICQEYARLAGLNLELHLVPFTRSLKYIESGQSYGENLTIGQNMLDYAIDTGIGGYTNIMVVGKKGTGFASAEDLEGKLVGALRGVAFADEIERRTTIRRHNLDTEEQGMKMLKLGRLDAMVANEVSIRLMMKLLGFSKADFGGSFVVGRTPWSFLVSKKAHVPEVTDKIRQAAKIMRKQVSPQLMDFFFNEIDAVDLK